MKLRTLAIAFAAVCWVGSASAIQINSSGRCTFGGRHGFGQKPFLAPGSVLQKPWTGGGEADEIIAAVMARSDNQIMVIKDTHSVIYNSG